MAKDVTLTIDGLPVTVPEGTLLVEAAKQIRTDIPVYCYHPKLGPAGLCRICLVEIEKTPKLQIACNTVVTDGMVVHTYGSNVEDGRRAVLEFLLLNHPLDCPICDKGGECDLQDFSMAYGQGASRLAEAKESKPKALDLGPTIVLDDERCIVCQRCSRFDEIITHERSLVVMDRGQRDVIATATGEPYRSNYSGNVTELCPVGALTSKTYRFKSRPWDLARTQTTCTQCSVGCAIHVDVRHGEILRTMSVPEDDAVSDGWLCDRGRYNVGFYSDARRLTAPMLRDGDAWSQISWEDALALWAARLRVARQADKTTIAAVGSGRLLNEEAYLLGHFMRGLGSPHFDWRVRRQRQGAPGPLGGAYADLDAAQVIVIVGRPPSQTAPVMDLRIRKAAGQLGARLIIVGDHAIGSPIAHERVRDSKSLTPAAFEGAERVAFVWDGIDVAAGAQANATMQKLASAGKRVAAFVAGDTINAYGVEAMGLVPGQAGLDANGIFEAGASGRISVLSMFGANPVLHSPAGAGRVRFGLGEIPFVVATELFMTESAKLATLVLPARGPFEKSGHVCDLTGRTHAVRAAVAAPSGTLSDGEILVAIASELGIEVPAPGELQARATSASSNASGFADPAICGEPAAARTSRPKKNDLRLTLESDSFAGAGTLAHDDRLAELWVRPHAALNPKTALSAGVGTGDVVDLTAGSRVVSGLVVRTAADLPDGVVSIVDGLPGAPASEFSGGELVTVGNVRAAPALVGVSQ